MATSAPTARSVEDSFGTTARIWSLHLLCFALPLTTLVFFLTAPHSWIVALAFFGVVIASVMADNRTGNDTHQPRPSLPGWPFDGVLYALLVLHVVNVALMVTTTSAHGFWRIDTLVAWQLMGISAGYSGIVVAPC